MPRTPRVEYENAVYHAMARGNQREPIVHDDGDRQLFVDTFAEACGRTGWQVFAWVLMDNHYHAVFRTPEANLVAGMQWFQNAYTRRLNTYGVMQHSLTKMSEGFMLSPMPRTPRVEYENAVYHAMAGGIGCNAACSVSLRFL